MSEIAHIVSPASAGWTGWLLFGLLLCAVLAEFLQRGIITQSLQSVLTHSNRTYKDAPVNFWAQVLITIFRVCVIALAVYLCCYIEGTFTFAAFAAICGLLVGLLIVKMLCHWILDYTFRFSHMFESAYEPYANIVTLASVVLYPIILILLRIDSAAVARWSVGAVAVLFLLIWFYRGGRIFIQSPVGIFYFALYLCTLEFLPMMALYYLSDITIQHLW